MAIFVASKSIPFSWRESGVVDEGLIKAVTAASLLHDMGKLAIPEHILNKPGKLTTANSMS